MQTQLAAIADEFESARARLHSLAERVAEELWKERPDPTRWSIAECVAHLNLTSSAYLPLLRSGIERARSAPERSTRRYRRDPIGWLIWKGAGPPVRFRVKTTPPFVPTAAKPRAVLIAEFERLQAEQLAAVRDSDGLRIDRVRIVSPFDARLKYNLFACLTILPRHQHRHLWQAEQAWAVVEKRG